MTPLQAFRELGPMRGGPAVRARRAEAAAVILRQLTAMKGALRESGDFADDAVGQALHNLTRIGPRGIRADDPETDEAVRAYLLVVLRNACRTLRRSWRRQHFDAPPVRDSDVVADAEREVEQSMDVEWARSLREWAKRELAERVIPDVARSMTGADGERFLESMAALGAIVAGTTTLDQAVRTMLDTADETTRETMRARFRRSKQRIALWLHHTPGAHAYAWTEMKALEQALQDLSLRASGTTGAARS